MLQRPVEPAQYTLISLSERLSEEGIAASVGSVGSSCDNALAETINGLFKTEIIKPQAPWKGVDEVEFATTEWVDWFNHRRIYEYCGDIPPVELGKAHYTGSTQPVEELEQSHHRVPGPTGAIQRAVLRDPPKVLPCIRSGQRQSHRAAVLWPS